jgi:hypothetical protein
MRSQSDATFGWLILLSNPHSQLPTAIYSLVASNRTSAHRVFSSLGSELTKPFLTSILKKRTKRLLINWGK